MASAFFSLLGRGALSLGSRLNGTVENLPKPC
jgi:hypothetical protein